MRLWEIKRKYKVPNICIVMKILIWNFIIILYLCLMRNSINLIFFINEVLRFLVNFMFLSVISETDGISSEIYSDKKWYKVVIMYFV